MCTLITLKVLLIIIAGVLRFAAHEEREDG
jgi:hypothetical protein